MHIDTVSCVSSATSDIQYSSLFPMPSNLNLPLIVGATLSAAAALMHIGVIIGGASWYRFFGAGERMARAAERGKIYPTIVTLLIVAMLALWSACAFSGAGLLPQLPLLRSALCFITAVYLARGLIIFPMALFKPAAATPFSWWSSLICLNFGVVHLWGVAQAWNSLT